MFKHMTTKVKCRSSGNSALWLAVMEEKIVHESAVKFATTKSNAVASLLRWSRGEQNSLLSHIFGRVAELNWMWKEAMDEFDNQYMNYRRHFKKIFQEEKEVEEQRKVLMALHPKVTKARKQVEAAMKKGDVARLPTLESELETLSSQYDSLQQAMLGAINKLELEKIGDVRNALIQQSNAFVELADKCQVIFKAQGAMMELIPESVDLSFLSEDHQSLRKHLCTLVSTTAERLEMVPPIDGGIDSQQSLQLFVSPVTTQYRYRSESLSENVRSGVHKVSRHVIPTNPDKIGMVARKGNIGPPVPPRSQISLGNEESIYVVPNNASFKKALTTKTSNTSDEDDYVVIVSNNQKEQLGLTRSYSDSQILYTRTNGVIQPKAATESPTPTKTKPPRPPAPKLFRDLTPSPSPTPPPEDPPYQTPIDALQLPCINTHNTQAQKVVRTVSECPVRLERVRGSSRRKHQPVKRVSVQSPPPLLKSLSLDCLVSLNDSDDDYDEIYSNPYDCIDKAASSSKPVHVTARLSVSSAGIPSNCRPCSRQSNNSQSTTPPLVQSKSKSYSVECLDTVELSDNPNATSVLLQRRRLRYRHSSLDDSVKRLRAKKGLQNSKVPRKASMEIQTYPESPQHLRGVGSQENLFFSESTTSSVILEESTDSVSSKRKISNGISNSPKVKNHKKKALYSKPSRGALANLFKKKPKDT